MSDFTPFWPLYFILTGCDEMQPILSKKNYRKESTGMISLAVISFFIVVGRLPLCFGQLVRTTTKTTMITTLSTTTKAPMPTVKVPILNFTILFVYSIYMFLF